MKTSIRILCASVLLCCAQAQASSAAHWGYSGHEGPEHWGDLDPGFALCGTGKNQSPIDLSGFVEADMAPIAVGYGTGAQEVINNGHTIQANVAPGSTITVDGHSFELKQLHFHAPSENHVEGRSFPLEGHLVHADADGNLAVVAVMFVEGGANPAVAAVWDKMPAEAGGKAALETPADPKALLPDDRDYYRFNGSLTTPPCTEGVWWLVMKRPVTVSKEQVAAFEKVMHHPNNRPVQPVNARPVLK